MPRVGGTISNTYGRIVRGILPSVDQHECNACWAIATCQTVSDRLHLQGKIPNDQLNYYAYHDIIISHTPDVDGCATGIYLDIGLDMFVTNGAPLMSDTQDRQFNDTYIPSDINKKMYKVRGWKDISSNEIIGELDNYGPLVGVINLYPSFNSFVGNGIYTPLPTESIEGSMSHMISIVGYDTNDSTWIIRNSYGPSFGNNGLFKIRWNDPKLGLEQYVYAPIL